MAEKETVERAAPGVVGRAEITTETVIAIQALLPPGVGIATWNEHYVRLGMVDRAAGVTVVEEVRAPADVPSALRRMKKEMGGKRVRSARVRRVMGADE